MREIKFRAWDKKTKKMREVNSIAFHNQRGVFDHDKSNTPKVVNVWGRNPIEDKDIILHREAKDVEIMQFTGLRDKNGRDIYVGDLLEEEPGYLFEVVWEAEYLKYSLKWLTKAIQYPGWNRGREMVIAGNIYENKELLTK